MPARSVRLLLAEATADDPARRHVWDAAKLLISAHLCSYLLTLKGSRVGEDRATLAMSDFRIDVFPARLGSHKCRWRYAFFEERASNQPLLDAARWLLAQGLALPSDRVTTYRDGKPCLTGLVGVAAALEVVESPSGGPYFRKYRGPWTARFPAEPVDDR